jgi:hypothetical protein
MTEATDTPPVHRETRLERLRRLFPAFFGKHYGKPQGASRYTEYGLFDAHTGDLLAKFDTCGQAEAAKTSRGDRRLRVRGVPPGMKVKRIRKPRKRTAA